MSEKNAKFLEILISQIRKYRDVDAILGEALRILGQTDIIQPLGDLLHLRPRGRCRASIDLVMM